MLMPALSEAKQKAKKARWLGQRSQVRIDADCVAYYTFDHDLNELYPNGVSNLANFTNDSEGRYNAKKLDCPRVGTPPIVNSGRWKKQAAYFNGSSSNQYFSAEDYDYLEGADELTIEAWVYPVASNGIHVFVSKRVGYNSSQSFLVWVQNKNVYARFVLDNGTDQIVSTSGSLVQPGRWYHIVAVLDVHNTADEIKVYVDGKMEKSSNITNDTSAKIVNADGPLYIGTANASYSNNWNGYLDELAIYRRALSAQDVLNNYSMGTPY
jgi:hypothetical protein